MSAIDTLININISVISKAVPQKSFSIPLIIGPTTTGWSDFVHAYTSAADMLSDGFTTSSPEYVYALELTEQGLVPTQFYVGRRTLAVIQVDTITPTAVDNTLYEVTIGTANYSYTSGSGATVSQIVSGLIALINADSTAPCIASGSVTLILTAKVAGAGFQTSINANVDLALVHTTANHGIADDLNNIISENNNWYGIVLCSNADSDIEQLAAAVQPLIKIFLAASSDSAIATSSNTDLLSNLQGKNYTRTALIYSPGSANLGIDAAWLGGQLPAIPGSNNWAFQTLVGISPDNISDNSRSIIIGDPVAQVAGKNGNIYTTVAGVDITQMGIMVGGQFIDITIGADWLQNQIQTNIYQLFVNAAQAHTKVPYTNKGTAQLIQCVQSAIDVGIVNGLIDGAQKISITAPDVTTISITQRANRVAPTISFTCVLQGAFNAAVVNGTVTV
jgi:hypothetical protein